MTIVGIDLGGTKVAAASLRDGELGPAETQRTDRSGQASLLDQLAALVGRVKRGKLQAVGIGVPSVVEFETGRVVRSINVPLADVALRHVLYERLGVPVFVDNDATVAALAEAHDHDLRMVARNLVMITVGTGVGGGLVLGGRIYRGATGGAGELGQTLVAADLRARFPAPEAFPQPGSLERVAAGSALDRLAARVAASRPDSALGKRAKGQPVRGPDVTRAACAGDRAAIGALTTWAHNVGIGVANAINTFDPDEVVLGGGGARAGEFLLEPVRRVASSYVAPGLGRKTRIRLAWHGARAGVLGAALLALHELGPSFAGVRAGHAERASLPGPIRGEK